MDLASKVFVIGGLLNLVFAFAVGFAMSERRRRTPEPSRYLLLAHRVSLWWGFLLLGMPWVARLSALPPLVEALAAGLFVVASMLSDAEPLLNLAQGVDDPVAERSLGFYVGGAAGILASISLLPMAVGAFLGL
jgi:hypothetical protein